jgi:hypothetical protein
LALPPSSRKITTITADGISRPANSGRCSEKGSTMALRVLARTLTITVARMLRTGTSIDTRTFHETTAEIIVRPFGGDMKRGFRTG